MIEKNNFPEITVLMTVFNGEKWLKQSIVSVLNQSNGNFEFIIIDDGSTDDSYKIIKEFAIRDSRIVPIKKHNTGLADSLNIGIRRARGKWIARIDADDVCEVDRLEKQLFFANANPEIHFVGSNFKSIDEYGSTKKIHNYPSSNEKLVKLLLRLKGFPPHSSAFFKSETVKRVGGYRVRLKRAQDYDLWLRISEVGKVAAIQEPLVSVRKHSEQISNEDMGERQILDSRLALISYWLRNLGFHDPIQGSDSEFEFFRQWAYKQLIKVELFARLRFYQEIKELLRGTLARPRNIFAILKIVLLHFNIAISSVSLKFFGDSISYRLAVHWGKERRVDIES